MDDLEIDDLLQGDKKKRKNSCRKGKRGEAGPVKILTERFGKPFSRSIGSGNRWSQVTLTEQAKQVFSGDLVVPEGFAFVIEVKNGYEDEVDLHSAIFGKCRKLDEFFERVTRDADYTGRKPLLLWKRARKPWLAFLRTEHLPGLDLRPRFVYGDWTGCSLELILRAPDAFFFPSPSE